jgi:hypothetical protein
MRVSEARFVVRIMAVWTAASALTVLFLLAGGLKALLRLHGALPTSILLVPMLMAGTAALGVFGALRLWRTRQDGRVASIISGGAVLIGVAPAAILRGDTMMIAWVTVTGVVVLGLLSPAVRAVCTRAYTR